jgi:hypothetical protein
MKAKSLIPVFTESIPASLEPGNLHVSMLYETAVHLCACGCGTKVDTPFGPHDWAITFDGTVSLHPSVGNGQQARRSHYYVRNDRIDWLPPISKRATQSASARDRAAHAQRPAPPVPKPWWRRTWDHIRRANRATQVCLPLNCSSAIRCHCHGFGLCHDAVEAITTHRIGCARIH